MFDIDTGSSGSGSTGPWINWHSDTTKDGTIPGRSFSLRNDEGRKVFKGFDKGVIFDIDNMKLGWGYSTGMIGSAPEWQWNPSLSQFLPSPGKDWKRGFSIPIATQKGNVALWEQAAAGAYQGFEKLVPQLREREGAKLPLIIVEGYEQINSKRGPFHAPNLKLKGWVDRPEAFKETIATEPEPAKSAPADEPDDDDAF